nr:recombinase family protein [Anaerolineae bacterium]
MTLPTDTQKIQTTHLARQALVYVRQSTPRQVRHNLGSQQRQYDFTQQALALGWSAEQIVVIDDDQGRSATAQTARSGFQFLIAEISLGHAGAIFSLEVSRLARASSEWCRLLEVCALTQTMVIDEDGVYDPRHPNDRLLLGFKGTMSEAEWYVIRSRMQGGKLAQAQQGLLCFHPPTGYVHDANGNLIKDPDQAIQASIQQVFDQFEQLGSAGAVVTYFQQEQHLLPTRRWGRAHAGECEWKLPSRSRILDMLHNPCYAGTYVYGRTRTIPKPGDLTHKTSRQLPPAEWQVVIPDHHAAYLSPAQFEKNQAQLQANYQTLPTSQPGIAREGAGLLQGIVLCGHCGRRMTVRYQEDKTRPIYYCEAQHRRYNHPMCQAIRGQRIDARVSEILLAALQPVAIEQALTALNSVAADRSQAERHRQLQLERVQYEADLARRRYMAVEPENRLVARTLEHDWNQKLQQLEVLQRAQNRRPTPGDLPLTDQERQQVLALVQDVPALWHAPTTTPAERKQMLRFLIRDVTLLGLETTIQIGIVWQTDATTQVTIPRGTKRTDPAIIDHIRRLAAEAHSDEQIASWMNAAGYTTARCHPFTAARVHELRRLYRIDSGLSKQPRRYPSGQREDGRYTTWAAAELLDCSVETVIHWCRTGRLDALQARKNSPYWIALPPR